jgi:hypothetical protein
MLRSQFVPGWATVAALLAILGSGSLSAAEPKVRGLRSQRVGDTTYFHVSLEAPPEMRVPQVTAAVGWSMPARRDLARLPRLVPQDGKTSAVYHRLEIPGDRPAATPLDRPLPVTGLEFVGKCRGEGPAQFLLLYPTEEENVPHPAKDQSNDARSTAPRRRGWAEVRLTLDFTAAQNVPPPDRTGKRPQQQPPSRDDLERLWAAGQAAQFAVLQAQAPEFGFYSFAREATGRKYGVPVRTIGASFTSNRELVHRELYETTTGAAAIAESLQLQRLLSPNSRDRGDRTVDVATVPGITIAEHPWEQMMGDRKPSPEPLAKLVPHDNYYVHFKNIRKFIEFGELIDQWGTNVVRAYEVSSRDYRLKERYEKQLCLRSTGLARTLGPAVVHGLAITGSDLYVREGSDVTVIFRVANRPLFLAAVEPFLGEARKEFSGQLQESKKDYHGVTVESFVTPQREVSLHRAALGEFVIYSNSPAGLRRVLDAHQGRHKALADSLDFQYMRTVFRLEDEQEDGFAFLSDAFIRQLVGPASKIKEKRRLEALTSLYMVTHAALFAAWENGKLPRDRTTLLAASELKLDEVYMPEGNEVAWDPRKQVATSDAYNTIQFATPLIELPIEKVTPTEEQDYLRFRGEYMGLWRRFFDPIGMRIGLGDGQVRVDTYILPLIQNSQYNELRQRTGGGTTPLDPARISPATVVQLLSHIAPDAPERTLLAGALDSMVGLKGKGLDWLGDWFLVRLDDSPVYAKLAQRIWRQEMGLEEGDHGLEQMRLFFQVPLTVGIKIRNTLVFTGVLAALKTKVLSVLPGALTWEPLEPEYKGVGIVRIQATANGELAREFNRRGEAKAKEPFLPAVYYALIDGGWYISLSDAPLKELIDRSVARAEGKEAAKKGEVVPVNSSLYLAPGAADKARDFVRAYLEWETHRRALANVPLWYALFHSGLVAEGAPETVKQGAALRYFGFVPVSAEGTAFTYEPKTDEVVNQRHGSPRHPRLHAAVESDSPLGQLLDQLRTIRADLRFREDGVHTVLTIERKAPVR